MYFFLNHDRRTLIYWISDYEFEGHEEIHQGLHESDINHASFSYANIDIYILKYIFKAYFYGHLYKEYTFYIYEHEAHDWLFTNTINSYIWAKLSIGY